MVKVFNVKTDYVLNPLGIDNKTPAFSWQLQGANEYQQNYQVQVATSMELLDTPDMWDSGVVNTNKQLFVRYAGAPLQSFTRYYVKVTVNGTASDIAWFETAYLNPEEFEGDWIGMPLGFGGCVDDVRYDFVVDKPVKKARFYLCALGCARVYLNGQLLDDCYFDGALSVFEKTVGYRTYEINPVMGKNALCIKVGYGYYGAKKICGVMRVWLDDNGKEEVSVTPTFAGRAWNVKKDVIVGHSLYGGEIVDYRLKEDWLNPDYQVSFGNWVATFACDRPRGEMKAITIPPMRVTNRFKPLSITEYNGGYMVDAGANICGFAQIKVSGNAGDKVILKFAEKLLPNGSLDRANLRAAECTDELTLSGDGVECYAPQFTYHGFRFFTIETVGNVKIEDVEINYLMTNVTNISQFECDNQVINKLHEIAVRTEANNLNGVFTDCPQRDERLGWLNDLSGRIYQSIFNFDLGTFLPNFIDMITYTQDKQGAIPDTVPFYVGCKIADPVSAYTILGIKTYEMYGNIAVLENNYQGFEKWIALLKSYADLNGGVLNHALYGDWCPAKIYANDTFSKQIETTFVSAAYFLWYLKQMATISNLINKQDKAEYYSQLYVEYKKYFDEKYYNKETGLYHTGTQPVNAIISTIFSDDKQLCARLMKATNDDIINIGYHMTCGSHAYRHLIYNLAEYGYSDTVIKLLTNPEYPGWGYMIACGATSVWERWENEVGTEMHSFNHPMFSGYDGFLYNYVLGIKQEKCVNQFENIVIEPAFECGLNNAKGKLSSVKGEIAVEWKKVANGYELNLSTPANTTLTVVANGCELNCNQVVAKDSLSLTNGQFTVKIIR